MPFTWNRTVLDRSVKRAFEKADPTRPVVAHSGVAPHLPQLDGTDSHLYFGWYHGDEDDLGGFAATVPRMVRFVTEFGAQSVPNDAAFMEPDRWPDLDWDHLARRHSLQKSVFDRRVPPELCATFDAWRAATQGYQALLLKHQIETLRRLKYRPTGGFCMFSLTDAYPSVTFSVLGHDRSAKAGYHALTEACRPVIVVADRLPGALDPGRTVKLDVHVVNDLRHGLDGAVVTATMGWPDGGERRWRWQGDVGPDSCVRVGRLTFTVPALPGPVSLDLDRACGDVAASNRSTSRIGA
jgi:beta-mannosidase